jgi:hypothetical protein
VRETERLGSDVGVREGRHVDVKILWFAADPKGDSHLMAPLAHRVDQLLELWALVQNRQSV